MYSTLQNDDFGGFRKNETLLCPNTDKYAGVYRGISI